MVERVARLACGFALLYNHLRHQPWGHLEEGTIESEIAEEAAVLTGIGIGTAFGLLVLLMAVVIFTGSVADRILRRATVGRRGEAVGDEVEDRDKALAAAVAVATLKARSERADKEGGGR